MIFLDRENQKMMFGKLYHNIPTPYKTFKQANKQSKESEHNLSSIGARRRFSYRLIIFESWSHVEFLK